MRYIQNITAGNVRVAGRIEATPGGHVHESVTLEPAQVTLKIDPKTRERDVRPGQNVAAVPDEWFGNREFTRSLDYLFAEIEQEAFEARQDVIDGSMRARDTGITEIPGFLSRDHVMKFDEQKNSEVVEDVTRIPMDPETLEMYAGAESGTRSRPDNDGGRTLTETRGGGVRRAEGEATPVDPALVQQMGQGA